MSQKTCLKRVESVPVEKGYLLIRGTAGTSRINCIGSGFFMPSPPLFWNTKESSGCPELHWEVGVMSVMEIWEHILWPLVRILLFISVGLLVANLIESLNWTNKMAILARPLIRMGRLSSITGASFSMAFVSGVSANTMLAEAYEKKDIGKKELVLANLFNSLPRFFLHLPTVFFLTAPFIHGAAFIYVGITFSAALLQTFGVVLAGRFLLTGDAGDIVIRKREKITFTEAWKKSVKRLRRRIPKILKFLLPVYILFFILGKYGVFKSLEAVLAKSALLSWLNPQSLSIVILHVSAEFSAGLAAASVLLANNSLGYREVILALLVGNILAAPIRALRHQFPYYVGIFNPKLAVELVGVSQVSRALCVIIIGWIYFIVSY